MSLASGTLIPAIVPDRWRTLDRARKGGRPGQSQHLRDVPKPPVEEELDK
ncbi:hypothetical protein [Streptomyces sp. 8N706]